MDKSFETARSNMIQQQIRPWAVLDERVLQAMSEIHRELFVPDAYKSLAYADIEVPIGDAVGQSMLAPKVVGRMLQALDLQGNERILEIGAGTGYVTACLARLGARVVSLEIDPELAQQAQANLQPLDLYQQVEVRVGDALAGTVEGAPFDAIAVTGSIPDDDALAGLQEQLAVDGRLFVVIGEAPVMKAVLVTRIGSDAFRRDSLFETLVPGLVNVPEPEHFVF
jgi:protein-L-isoaspartate(D-aspartate) O-methyltransferase